MVLQQRVQKLPGRPYKGPTLLILGFARRLADEQNRGIGIAFPGHGVPTISVERALDALPDVVMKPCQFLRTSHVLSEIRNSRSHASASASLGARQSLRGERDPPDPTLGHSAGKTV